MTCKQMCRGCIGCQYFFQTVKDALCGCDYLLTTGQRRGCSPKRCKRKVIGKKLPLMRFPIPTEGQLFYTGGLV